MKTATYYYIKRHLVCEFTHWDLCLSGLCLVAGEYYVCWLEDDDPEDPVYAMVPVVMDAECLDYLEDYRKSYHHWCYVDGRLPERYDGRPLAWFGEKWKRNPILERAPRPTAAKCTAVQ